MTWRVLLLVALALGVQCTPSPPAAAQSTETSSAAAAPSEAVEAAEAAVEEAAAPASDATAPEEEPSDALPAEAAQSEGAEEEEEPELVSSPEEEAVDASTPEELPEVRSGSASVQWVVTKKMQAKLSALGYSDAEITQLDPERAAAIIRRSITRPASGVPAGWNRGVRRQQHPVRAAVQAGQSLLTAVQKASANAPPAVPLVLTGLLGALGCLKVATGGGSSGGARVKQALAPVVPAIEETPSDSSPGSGTDDLWLDVQIDRFIAFLKTLISGK